MLKKACVLLRELLSQQSTNKSFVRELRVYVAHCKQMCIFRGGGSKFIICFPLKVRAKALTSGLHILKCISKADHEGQNKLPTSYFALETSDNCTLVNVLPPFKIFTHSTQD